MAGTTRISLRRASATALALALAACGQQRQASIDNTAAAQNVQALGALPPLPEVQPLAEGPATPVRYAPPVSRLPSTQTLGYADAPQDARYAWIDRADWISDTIGDAPPDYYFDYDGVEPWAWQTSGDYLTYAEPIDDGYRYYYYEPGADYPYLVRDPQYSYGYRDGRIATIYDRQGRYLAAGEARRQAESASRYYARARALRVAARGNDRRGVAAAQWAARRPVIAAARTDWREARQRVPDWQAYRQRHAADESQRLQPERVIRQRAAERFASWQQEGQAGRPPQLYGRPNDRADRAEGARQADQRRQQSQRDMTQQRAGHERQQQQAAQQQVRDGQRAQAEAQRDAARQRAATDQQRSVQQQAARRDQARREPVPELQRAQQQAARQQQVQQQGQQLRQQREAQHRQAEQRRGQQQAVRQQQAQQRGTEQRGQQMRQQRDAQRQQAEQQRAVQQQQAQQRGADQRGQQVRQQRDAQRQQAEQQHGQQRAAQQQQAQQQAVQQRAQQQAAQQQQHAAQQAQQSQQRAMQRPQPGQGPGREHGNR
jgi:hypothetical protein